MGKRGGRTGYVEQLRRLVSFDTTNDPVRGRKPDRQCPEYLRSQMEERGLATWILEQQGYYSVLGVCGEGRPVTLFLAHFDTVPAGTGWDTEPLQLTVKDGRGYGRGAIDDKANIVALLMVAEELAEHRLPGTVIFAFTGDEEVGGTNGAGEVRRWLDGRNLFPDYLVTADGAGMQIVTRRRNAGGITVKVPHGYREGQGTVEVYKFTTQFFERESRHAAYFLPGVDRHAMLAASAFLRFNPHLQVADVRGGFIKSNVVPDWVELTCLNPITSTYDTKSGGRRERVTFDWGLTKLLRMLLPLSRINFPALPSDFGITLTPNMLRPTPEGWEVYFDLRAMTIDGRAVEEALHTLMKESAPDLEYQIHVRMGPAYMQTSPKSRLVQTARKVAKQLGLEDEIIELAGATDTRHFADRPVEAIDYGPLGGNVHGSNEYVLLDSIPRTATFYTSLLRSLHQDSS